MKAKLGSIGLALILGLILSAALPRAAQAWDLIITESDGWIISLNIERSKAYRS